MFIHLFSVTSGEWKPPGVHLLGIFSLPGPQFGWPPGFPTMGYGHHGCCWIFVALSTQSAITGSAAMSLFLSPFMDAVGWPRESIFAKFYLKLLCRRVCLVKQFCPVPCSLSMAFLMSLAILTYRYVMYVLVLILLDVGKHYSTCERIFCTYLRVCDVYISIVFSYVGLLY